MASFWECMIILHVCVCVSVCLLSLVLLVWSGLVCVEDILMIIKD